MALTITQADYLSNNDLQRGVAETIVKESPLLARFPWVEVIGNAFSYNRELALPTVGFHPVGDTWTESTPTFTPISVSLKILGGDADVDSFLAKTRRDTNDLEAVTIESKAKAWAHTFEYTAVYGDASANVDEFSGLHRFITGDATAQQVHAGSGSTGAALTLAKLDEMIDLIKPGKPDFLMMTRRTRRGLSAYGRTLTSPVNFSIDEFGHRIEYYDGIPIIINDHQLDTETISSAAYALPTTGATSSVFAVKLGEEYVHGLNSGQLPTIENIGQLETKDATRTRVKGYVALALRSPLAIARLDGISSAAVTA